MPIPNENREFLRDVGLLLGLPLLALTLLIAWWHPWPKVYDVPPPSDIYQVASGRWDWADSDSACVKNPHTISFSANHKVVWDLLLASPDVYYWHRADLPFSSVTRPVRRCLTEFHLPSPESSMPRAATPSPK